jgi:hypothetical protein
MEPVARNIFEYLHFFPDQQHEENFVYIYNAYILYNNIRYSILNCKVTGDDLQRSCSLMSSVEGGVENACTRLYPSHGSTEPEIVDEINKNCEILRKIIHEVLRGFLSSNLNTRFKPQFSTIFFFFCSVRISILYLYCVCVGFVFLQSGHSGSDRLAPHSQIF